jgi:hypothetical protein
MARPRKTGIQIIHQVKLVLMPGQDDDLILYLSNVPDRGKAAAIKTAMRSGNLGAAADDDDEDLAGMLDALVL